MKYGLRHTNRRDSFVGRSWDLVSDFESASGNTVRQANGEEKIAKLHLSASEINCGVAGTVVSLPTAYSKFRGTVIRQFEISKQYAEGVR